MEIGVPTASESQNPDGNWASNGVGKPKPEWEKGPRSLRKAKTHLGYVKPSPRFHPFETKSTKPRARYDTFPPGTPKPRARFHPFEMKSTKPRGRYGTFSPGILKPRARFGTLPVGSFKPRARFDYISASDNPW